MIKKYCDKCKKEVEDYTSVYLPIKRKVGKKKYYNQEYYEICDTCLKKLNEYITEK